jgi:hypothetical protein
MATVADISEYAGQIAESATGKTSPDYSPVV